MKKFLSIVLVLALAFTLVSCAPGQSGNQQENTAEQTQEGTDNEATPGGEQVTYKDGTYTGEGDEWDHGKEDATVVIKDGKIESITLRRLDKEGNEVDYDLFSGKEVDGRLYPNLKQYRQDMADAMINTQSYEVDSISGATVTCDNWKLAVKRALEKAKQ